MSSKRKYRSQVYCFIVIFPSYFSASIFFFFFQSPPVGGRARRSRRRNVLRSTFFSDEALSDRKQKFRPKILKKIKHQAKNRTANLIQTKQNIHKNLFFSFFLKIQKKSFRDLKLLEIYIYFQKKISEDLEEIYFD